MATPQHFEHGSLNPGPFPFPQPHLPWIVHADDCDDLKTYSSCSKNWGPNKIFQWSIPSLLQEWIPHELSSLYGGANYMGHVRIVRCPRYGSLVDMYKIYRCLWILTHDEPFSDESLLARPGPFSLRCGRNWPAMGDTCLSAEMKHDQINLHHTHQENTIDNQPFGIMTNW